MEAVSDTALWTAAVRADESQLEDALFVDDLAADLAGEKGFALRDRYDNAGVRACIAERTRYLDEVIARHPSFRQVVFLAAGLDTRSVRLEWAPGTTLYEVDHADLVAWKEQRLTELGAQHAVERHTVGIDLREDWPKALEAAGWNPGVPTMWIAEGLFYYLPEDGAREMLARIAELAAPGDILSGDLVSRQTMISESEAARRNLVLLQEDGSPWLFATDDPEEYLSTGGWEPSEVLVLGHPGANFGRWPGPAIPREVMGIPRNFFFFATKRG